MSKAPSINLPGRKDPIKANTKTERIPLGTRAYSRVSLYFHKEKNSRIYFLGYIINESKCLLLKKCHALVSWRKAGGSVFPVRL